MSTRYAASHHRLLTESQTTAFIAALDHARSFLIAALER